MLELPWIAEARKYIGLKEDTSKSLHNPTIQKWLSEMGSFSGEQKAWWKDDEMPWCGLFTGACLGHTQRFVVPEWYRAKSWLDDSMQTILAPAYGCIVVFTRVGGGHVGFVVGKNKFGQIMVLGGNQGNEVSIKPFDLERVSGYRWPSLYYNRQVKKSTPSIERYTLPILNSDGKVSVNEA